VRNRMRIGFVILLALLTSHRSWAQTGASVATPQSTSGAATDVSNAEIQAAFQSNPSDPLLDRALRVVSINGKYNVGIAVVRRNKTTGPVSGGAIEHSQITEVYHVISGNGTLVTGGMIDTPKLAKPDSETVKVVGPSTDGDKIQGGVSRDLGPGDVVIIPPNTPHWFSQVTSEQIVYLVVRVDPKKVLQPVSKSK
jgi:mannose-6-phosphate isomerase-like protein (cupin superfamily)